MRAGSKFLFMILAIGAMVALSAVIVSTVLGIAKSSKAYQNEVLQGTEELGTLPDNITGGY